MTRDHAAARARRRCRPLTSAYRLAIAREFADGGSLRGVAEALRVDPAQLHRWLRSDPELRRLVHLGLFVAVAHELQARAFPAGVGDEDARDIERALFAPAREREALLGPWLEPDEDALVDVVADIALRLGPERVASGLVGLVLERGGEELDDAAFARTLREQAERDPATLWRPRK